MAEKQGTLTAALQNARKLLAFRPAAAEAQARGILASLPDQREAVQLLLAALRAQKKYQDALGITESRLAANPCDADLHYSLGTIRIDLGRGDAAPFARAVALNPCLEPAWRALAEQRARADDNASAATARARLDALVAAMPQVNRAAAALQHRQPAEAENLLGAVLERFPGDAAALCLMAEVKEQIGQPAESENLLAGLLEAEPDFVAARQQYAVILLRHDRPQAALTQVERLLCDDPHQIEALHLKALALTALGEVDRAADILRRVLKRQPQVPLVWMELGHALRAGGRSVEAVAAYRKSIALAPDFGENYWNLANLKTFRFGAAEIASLRERTARADLPEQDRSCMLFALGKALEDTGAYAESFDHYYRANALQRARHPYNAAENANWTHYMRETFSADFFVARGDFGSRKIGPIFVVGLPRSGSTLIEQILASHPDVEGTMELPDISQLAMRLNRGGKTVADSVYAGTLAALTAEAARGFGEAYLAATRSRRGLHRPLFVDKTPNNFRHVGLIRLILPAATVIDMRRHPLGCGFSCFKQYFATGSHFCYDLHDIGRYYADYVALMAHYDAVLPGFVTRIFYERLVSEPEAETRRLLDACGLPFEESCLRFYENRRAVHTPSSEQVRQPIFTDGLERWRRFEPWLAPLKDALGEVLADYPFA